MSEVFTIDKNMLKRTFGVMVCISDFSQTKFIPSLIKLNGEYHSELCQANDTTVKTTTVHLDNVAARVKPIYLEGDKVYGTVSLSGPAVEIIKGLVKEHGEVKAHIVPRLVDSVMPNKVKVLAFDLHVIPDGEDMDNVVLDKYTSVTMSEVAKDLAKLNPRTPRALTEIDSSHLKTVIGNAKAGDFSNGSVAMDSDNPNLGTVPSEINADCYARGKSTAIGLTRDTYLALVRSGRLQPDEAMHKEMLAYFDELEKENENV